MLKRWSIIFIVVILFFAQVASAETPGVIITPGEQTYTEQGFKIDVVLEFVDLSLYNKDVYLSYHALDQSGNVLFMEGQRTQFTIDESGKSTVTFDVQCADIPELSNIDDFQIQFDLIDQANEYWFSDRGLLHYTGAPVYFERERLGGGQMQEDNLDASSGNSGSNGEPSQETSEVDTISAILNLLAWGGIIVILLKKVLYGKNR